MKKIIVLCTLALAVSCTQEKSATPDQKIKEAINEICTEFNISDYSYIITDHKHILEKKWNNSNEFIHGHNIISSFSTYLLIKQLIDSETLNEDSTLNTYTSFITDSLLTIKDIYQISEKQADFNPSTLEENKSYIQYISHKVLGYTLSDFEKKELGIDTKKKWDSRSLLKAMAKISFYTDQQNITGYLPMGDSIPNLYPTWFTRNMRYYAGWHVFKINNHTVFWNFFSDKKQSLLCIKCIDCNLFAGVLLPQSALPTPLDCNHEDLLQSPMAIAILKAMFLPANTPKINYRESEVQISNTLKKLKKSTYLPFYIKDLASRIVFYEKKRKFAQANILNKIYENLYPYALPRAYLQKPSIAEINYVSNRIDAIRTFTLNQETKVTIFSSGQCLLDSDPKNVDNADNITLSISYTNKQKKEQSLMYKFIYGSDFTNEFFFQNNPVKYTLKDLNDTTYLLEAKIPWKVLNMKKPLSRSVLKLNIFINDCDLDNQNRKSVLSWIADSIENGDREKKYGNLIFSTRKKNGNDTTLFCQNIQNFSKTIDFWNNIDFQKITKCSEGKVTSTSDNAARFRTGWDYNFFYIQVEVIDNIKNRLGIINVDKCWIENVKTGEPVWKQPGDNKSQLFPVCLYNQDIMLKAGTYRLRYSSDMKHSFERWLSPTPAIDNYGVRIYKKLS